MAGVDLKPEQAMSRLTASVIGGGVGGRLSLDALAASPFYDLRAAADLREEVRAALTGRYPGLRTYASAADMLADSPTDVVCVSTFAPSHEELTLAAIANGVRGLLVEKPLGHTAASGRRLVAAVQAAGLPMVVPHGLNALAHSLEIIERVHNGEIGRLQSVLVECTQWDIINAGIHWLTFVMALTGNEPVVSVMAQCDTSTRTYRDGMQVETIAVTYAETQSGVRVIMETGDDVRISRPGKGLLFRINGDRGQIEFWAWDPGYWLVNREHPDGAAFHPEALPVSGHRKHLESLAGMMISGQHDDRLVQSSLLALEVVEAAYLSSRCRCRVTFPLAEFEPPRPNDWDPGSPYSGTGGGRDGRQL